MRTACERAKQIPAQENVFKRLYLNIWTEQSERWMPMALWQACQRVIDWDSLPRAHLLCGAGLVHDAGYYGAGGGVPGRRWRLLGAAAVVLCRRRPCGSARAGIIGRMRSGWRRGYLEATAGNVVDYEAVRAKLNEWDVTYDVRAVGFDPWNATDLVNRLKEQDGLHCVPVRQGFASLSRTHERTDQGDHRQEAPA